MTWLLSLILKDVKYLVAVSGGIDSTVLLDMLVREGVHDLIVAHFDHGIREDSADDARFVEGLAKKYTLPFVTKREELGKDASEEMARKRRYEFLREEAKKHGAIIATAHHQDDAVESIAINLQRGTGWRGLAVLGATDVKRPLMHVSKSEIRDYARDHRLEWVEDSTNTTSLYLRNRLRHKVKRYLANESKTAVITLWERQQELKAQINKEVTAFMGLDEYSRYFFIMIDPLVASELLRTVVETKTGPTLTRPQLERALLAIKVARPGARYEAGTGVTLRFTATTFIA